MRIKVCPECGQFGGFHFAGCPEDVEPDEEIGSDDEETEEQDEAPDEFPTMKL